MIKLPVLLAVLMAVSAGSVGCSSTTTGSDGSSGATTSGGVAPAGLDGSYAGTYSGDASGAVTMTISGTSIDVVVTVSSQKYPATGAITSGGTVSLGVGAGNGVTVTFDGAFANSKGSGNWRNTLGQTGKWSVAK